MSKRKTAPPKKDPAQAKLDAWLEQAQIVDLRNQATKLNELFATCAANGDSRGAATISGELRRLNEAISESIFASGLVVSAGSLSDFATKFVELVLRLMTPWEQLLLTLDNVRPRLIAALPLLPESEREFVSGVLNVCQAAADLGASPILDVQFLVADLLREVQNRPDESYESLLRCWAKARRLKPE